MSVRSAVQDHRNLNEGRKCQIQLPDERRLEILIQPKLYAYELLDIVSSHFKLKEKDYFGLAFLDDTGHFNWLNSEKKVLEHDLPRKQGTNLVIHFLVRFYVESITELRDTSTVEVFYLNAKQAVFRGQIECDSETVFELAAHVLQASLGDFTDDATTKADLKRLPLITTSALREHPSIPFCEEKIIQYYKKLAGTSKGLAIVNYMTIIESLPTYGIHYFEVKDKKDIPWWLGISHKGIGVYDKKDKNVPRRIFVWKSLENLYYRDKKFSIEVHDPKRIIHTLSSFNLYEDAIREPIDETDELSNAITDPTTQVSVSRRTFGPGNVNVHAWFGANPQLTKCIWSMAVAQHQFYDDRKHSKANLPSVRSVSELATELSRSTSSLPGSLGSTDNISRSGSSASLPSLSASRGDLNFDPADTAKVQREMYSALKARREALEDILKKRTEELKLLCIKEGELTGHLPAETPLAVGEEPPQIRRRVGTAFSLSADVVPTFGEDDEIKKLEMEVDLQKQISNAAHKLASDKTVSRFVRKQRRHSFMKAQTKLKEMEKKLREHRKGDIPASPLSTAKYDDQSVKSLGGLTDSDSEMVSPAQSPMVPRGPRSNYQQHDERIGHPESPLHRSNTVPTKDFHGEREIASAYLSPTHSSPSLEAGYRPNSVYSTQYRNQTYPTLSSRSTSQISNQSDFDKPGGNLRLEGSLDSGFSSTNNMYNVNSRRTSKYESNQDLNSTGEPHYETLDNVFDNRSTLQPKQNNVDGGLRKMQNYGSLERNLKKRNNREYERKHSDTDTSQDNAPSKFGKRTSQSEYDLSTKGRDNFIASHEIDFPLPRYGYNRSGNTFAPSRMDRLSERSESTSSRVIELPVTHTTVSHKQYDGDNKDSDFQSQSRLAWQDSAEAEPSPIVRSPSKKINNEHANTGDEEHPGMCYSPRDYEGSRGQPPQKPPHTEHSVKYMDIPPNLPIPQSSKIVTVAKMSPSVEVSKPFEMKDFYKYSEKLRRQRLVEQYHQALVGRRPSGSSQHSSESDSYSSFRSQNRGTPGSQYRSSTSSSPFGSPVSSRHMPVNHPYSSQNNTPGENVGFTGERTNVSSSTSTSYEQGVSTTTSRVQYTIQGQSGRVLYKAQHQTSRHTHYTPPTSMKCEPVKPVNSTNLHDTSSSRTPRTNNHRRQYSTPERTLNTSMNSSFHLSPPGSLSRAFSNEMLEWYDGEGDQHPTSV